MSDDRGNTIAFDYTDRSFGKLHDGIGRVTLTISDDTEPMQEHQVVGYAGEVRDHKQRIGEVGFASMPLPGAIGAVHYQYGHRGWPTIIGVEDPRYRPTGLNPGESGVYIIDGAEVDGTGGVMRWLIRGFLGWIHNITGITINIGDDTNTQTINVKTVTLNVNAGTINILGNAGDVVVNGISLVHHTHGGVQAGGESTGPPNG